MTDSIVAPLNLPLSLPEQLIALARQAGEAILDVYNHPQPPDVMMKADDSPLTQADMAAHRCLVAGLHALVDIPLVSEEGDVPDYAERSQWPAYWLIDPLDGTKEFIARNGEFTVNIALMVANQPLLGVVHVPVSDTTYMGVMPGLGLNAMAQKWQKGQFVSELHTSCLYERRQASASLRVVASHRHGAEAVDQLIHRLETQWPASVARVAIGSSLKFCLLAEGMADIYPRFAPTCEWDTAAAQAVLTAAGGLVVEADQLTPLSYNGENARLLNPWFIAVADADLLSLIR